MPTLFEPTTAGDLKLANRIVMAPLTRNRSPRAVPKPITATYYEQRATAGLLITEATAISHQGQGYADVPGLYSDEQLAGWKRVTDAVHKAGGKIVVQMWHVGRISHTTLQPNGGAPVAPSAIRANAKTYIINADGTGAMVDVSEPRALDIDELPGIVEDYRRAARAAIDAGFDGVELHSANGYLLDQFLRSGSNTRTDAYGGSIENRARLMVEVMDAITAEIGARRVGIRISPVTPANDASDDQPQPLFTYVVQKLAKYDLSYVHVIEGATGGPRNHQQGSAPFDYVALKTAYRAAGGKGAWMTNNGYDRELADQKVESGEADLVAFGRPFISNPDLVRRLKENAPWNEGDRSTYYGGGEHGYTDYPTLP
ncbi:N-ethylmaleimide reductase [Bordetella ansorpii]|uniref:N-ethylmaleimide reductase n=1 Tax=Bordetella ansorpii TaxID=288768 RepID=A0A157RMG4_9BORD|nr:alkene reductase [Bordetella ansorpii]SAI59183.1 N-ethylmaleimide reductase [Bordetella ansorpii]